MGTDAPHTAVAEAGHELVAAVDALDDAERAFDQRVRTVLGVNNTDFGVLHWIDRVQRRGGTARVGGIAARFGVSSGSATEIVHRLTEAGLVRRVAHPTDARVRCLVLTEDAAARLDDIAGAVRTDLDALVSSILDGERDRLIELLDTVRDIYRSAAAR